MSSYSEPRQFWSLRSTDVKSSILTTVLFSRSNLLPCIVGCYVNTSVEALSKNDERRSNVYFVCSLKSVNENIVFVEFTSVRDEDKSSERFASRIFEDNIFYAVVIDLLMHRR